MVSESTISNLQQSAVTPTCPCVSSARAIHRGGVAASLTDMKDNRTLVAMVSDWRELLVREWDSPDIMVTVAVLKDGKATPSNWSLDYDEAKTSTGGCYARVFASGSGNGVLFSHYGPDVRYGDLRDYAHAMRALKLVVGRMEKMHAVRGSASDEASNFGRWLEATGVDKVYVTLEKSHSSWLNEQNWTVWTIGRFVNELRAKFPKVEAVEQATA